MPLNKERPSIFHSREALVGVDVGTTVVKVGLIDLDGEPISIVSESYATRRPRPGWVEQDPGAWLKAIENGIYRATGVAPNVEVVGIGICSQVNTHVFLDDQNRPIMPAIVWQDQRAAEVAKEIQREALESNGSDSEFSRLNVDSSSVLSRLGWLRQESPQLYDACRWVLSPKDFCVAALTGEVYSDPLSSIGIVDDRGDYVEGILRLVEGAWERMPQLVSPTFVAGESKASFGPLSAGVPVVVGTMDAWGSRYGSGVVGLGAGMEISGTSEIVGMVSDKAVAGYGVVSFPPLAGNWFHAGPTQAGGDAVRWLTNQIGVSLSDVERMAAGVPPGAGGLIFFPHLMGERAPIWDSDLRGSFYGLSADTTRNELVRSVLEGVAFLVRELLEAVEGAGQMRCASLRASGGGSRNDLWCQIKADVTGKTIERVATSSSGVLGAAIVAGTGIGVFRSDAPNEGPFPEVDKGNQVISGLRDVEKISSRVVRTDREFCPNQKDQGIYDELYEIYRRGDECMQPMSKLLKEFRDKRL